MRKVNQEITDASILEEILKHSEICRIGMIDNGLPYVLPFNYGYKDHQIYIHCAPVGKKIEVLRANSKVCFEVEEKAELLKGEKACRWSAVYRSIVGYATVEIITDFELKRQGLEIIMAHNGAPELIDFEPKLIDAVLILKLHIDSLTGKKSSNWDRLHTL
ncbi:MAG TPA: pyridoxamine 5'-phosphate oxidase family protein [Bacteroidales bacterium]